MTAYPADLLFRTAFQEMLRVAYKIEEQYVALIADRVLVKHLPTIRSRWNEFCARQGVTPVWDQVQEGTFSPHDPVLKQFRALGGMQPPRDRSTEIITNVLEDIARDNRTEPATVAFCRQRISGLVAMGNSQNPPAPGAPSPAPTPGWKGKARASPAPGGNASSQPAYFNPRAHDALPVKSEPRSPAPFPSHLISVRGSTPASHPTVPPAMPPTYEYSASAPFDDGADYTGFYPLTGSLDYGRDILPMPAQRPYKIPRTTMEDLFSPAERKDMREPEREFLKSVGL